MKIILFAIRALTHFKLYSTINIIGLALSLACVIIISRYVNSETTVDHFVSNLERVFVTSVDSEQNNNIHFSGIYNPNNEKGFIDITADPAVEKHSLFRLLRDDIITSNNQEYKIQTLITDTNFFKIMDFPIRAGNRDKLLQKPEEALISEKMAYKLFGKETPIGKIIHTSTGKDVTISGVIGAPATKTTINFDFVLSADLTSFWSRMPQSLILLTPNSDYKAINLKYRSFMEMKFWNSNIRYQLIPLSKVYFHEKSQDFGNVSGTYSEIWVLSFVTGLILLIGIFNFINIYSVVILRRAREFGMKKVFGAKAKIIFSQLLVENICMISIALFIGWILVEITKPLAEKTLNITSVTNLEFDLLLSIGILILLPMATTIMPFIRYNYSTPITSLRSVNNSGGSIISRKAFLLAQYIITFSLIVTSLFFIKQLQFMLHTDPGIRLHDIIKVQFMKRSNDSDPKPAEEWQAIFKKKGQLVDEINQKLNTSPLLSHWSYGDSPTENYSPVKFKTGDNEYQEVNLMFVSDEWMKTFDIQFTESNPQKPHQEGLSYNLYISESAKKLFGITDISQTELQPERRLWYSSGTGEDMSKNPPFHILGVFKDFNVVHLSKPNCPVVFLPNSSWYENPVLASIVPGQRKEAIEFLKKLHNDTVGGEFEYTFIEDEFKEMYSKDKQTALIYSIFALIAILISSLGLFSLSLFDVQQRFKEIAIRKVNGATDKMIMQMLLKKYLILLAIAFIIAVPLSWLVITKYLEDFAHKAPISWWLFAIAFLITAGISLATLIFHIRKAAKANPAKAIKTE